MDSARNSLAPWAVRLSANPLAQRGGHRLHGACAVEPARSPVLLSANPSVQSGAHRFHGAGWSLVDSARNSLTPLAVRLYGNPSFAVSRHRVPCDGSTAVDSARSPVLLSANLSVQSGGHRLHDAARNSFVPAQKRRHHFHDAGYSALSLARNPQALSAQKCRLRLHDAGRSMVDSARNPLAPSTQAGRYHLPT